MKPSFTCQTKRVRLWQIIFIVLIGLVASKHSRAQTVQAIEVRDSGFLFGSDFFRVFYVDDYVVYQQRLQHSESKMVTRIDSATQQTVYEDSLISTKWENRYFVFHRDSGFGYQYGPDKLYLTPRLAVAEINKYVAGSNTFEGLISRKPDSVIRNNGASEMSEIYLSPPKPDTPAVRVAFHYSKNLNHLNYSLNQVLDSAKKMKLWKIEFFIAAFYHKKSKTTYPAYYVGMELHELPGVIPPEALFYLNWYKEVVQWKAKAL